MASIKDILGFELFNLKDMLKGAKKNPLSLLLGAADPVGADIWSGITGREFEPLVNEFGGPSAGSFSRAKAAGIDTGLSKGSHDTAKVIAALFASNYGLDKLGGLTGGSGSKAAGEGAPKKFDFINRIPKGGSGGQPTSSPPQTLRGSRRTIKNNFLTEFGRLPSSLQDILDELEKKRKTFNA